MAKKEKIVAKKGESSGKKSSAASADPDGKAKKTGKDRSHREGKGKWHGHNSYADDLTTELAALGLRIKDITGDGNCFFRALGDQLQGEEAQHVSLRQRVMAYIAEHEDDFAPFVEDDESFGSYVARMRKDGVWAGYMEVVAASRCLGANLTIYQAGQPRWRVINHPEETSPMLHLSYHDGQHYNSVRCADDFGSGPPVPVVIRGAGTLVKPQRRAGDGSWDEKDAQRVAASTACTDMDLVHRALEKAGGDVEAAIEAVIEALAAEPEPAEVEARAGDTVAPTTPAGGTDAVAATEGGSVANGCSGRGGQQTTMANGQQTAAAAAPAVAAAQVAGGVTCAEVDSGSDPVARSSLSRPEPHAVGAALAAAAAVADGGGVASGGDAAAGAAVVSTVGAEDLALPGQSDATPAATASSDSSTGDVTDITHPLGSSEIKSRRSESPAAASAPDAAAAPAVAGTASAGDATTAAAAAAAASGRGGSAAAGRKRATEVRRVGKGIVVGGSTGGPSNNKRCPCGSNKKYKACCGPAAAAAERRRAAAGTAGAAAGEGGGAEPGSVGETVVVAQLAALVI